MKCGGCGNEDVWAWRVKYTKEDERVESCNACSGGFGGVPDVYFKGPYVDEHLSTEAHPGPKTITSRAEKKYWLNKCNLRESGDRVHGATNFDPVSHRHATESLRRKGYG